MSLITIFAEINKRNKSQKTFRYAQKLIFIQSNVLKFQNTQFI